MFYCFRRLISPIAAMVAILAMGMATPARADLEIWASLTQNPPTNSPSSNVLETSSGSSTGAFTGTIGAFSITNLSAGTNSSGTLTIGQENGSTVQISNTSGSTATIYLSIGSTGFINPVGSTSLFSAIGGSVTIGGGSNALTYQSYIDPTNHQNTEGSIASGAVSPTITAQGSYNQSVTKSGVSLAAPYSLTEVLALTLASNAEINFSSSTAVTPSVPEPSSLAIAGLGALGLIGYGIRRRKGA